MHRDHECNNLCSETGCYTAQDRMCIPNPRGSLVLSRKDVKAIRRVLAAARPLVKRRDSKLAKALAALDRLGLWD